MIVYTKGFVIVFEWDEQKSADNLAKRGLDFADAEVVFEGDTLTFEDKR